MKSKILTLQLYVKGDFSASKQVKIFEAILSSSRNIWGFQVCQAEPGSDDRKLQTHSFTLK